MKVFITGANGQLGRALQTAFKAHDLILTDYEHLDITCRDAVKSWIEKSSPDLVINAAAYTEVDKAEEEPERAFAVNAEGPGHLALITGEKKIPLLHVSTDYVFDGALGCAYHEEDLPNPQSVYGKSKLEGEKRVRELNPRHWIVRTAWLYSVHGKNFPKNMIRLASRGEVRVVNDQWGSPTYAPHLAEAVRRLAESGAYGLWHLAGSGQTTWYDWTRRLYDLLGLKVSVVPVPSSEFPRPAKRPPFSPLKSKRTPSICLPPWEEGLQSFVRELQ